MHQPTPGKKRRHFDSWLPFFCLSGKVSIMMNACDKENLLIFMVWGVKAGEEIVRWSWGLSMYLQ